MAWYEAKHFIMAVSPLSQHRSHDGRVCCQSCRNKLVVGYKQMMATTNADSPPGTPRLGFCAPGR